MSLAATGFEFRNIERISGSNPIVISLVKERIFVRGFCGVWVAVVFILLGTPASVSATQVILAPPKPEAVRLLPKTVGGFQKTGSSANTPLDETDPQEFGILAVTSEIYSSNRGGQLRVTLLLMKSQGAAYSYLTAGMLDPDQTVELQPSNVGTASVIAPDGINFVRGNCFVSIRFQASTPATRAAASEFGRQLATTLGSDTEEIPVLVKHLPQAESAYRRATYLVSNERLNVLINGSQPLLDAITFNADEEAVMANYGATQLLIVENNTPQLATDADLRIQKRLADLKASGQTTDAVYRRIGNYSVFAFHAPDAATANQLLDQVSYEKTVQWLGENPYPLQKAQHDYTRMMGGVVLAVVQGAGLAILICLFIGGIVGGIVFVRRRKQQAQSTAFSDAGGMLRLNLDELTPQMDHSRLLEKGNQ
jgi:uncharacterized membrane protein